MSQFTLIITGLVLFFVGTANASPTLTDVVTKRSGAEFIVEMSFTEDISDKDVSLNFTNGTIEVTVPHAAATAKKMFTRVNDTVVDHLYTAQGSSDSIQCRVILKKPQQAGSFEKKTLLSSRAN